MNRRELLAATGTALSAPLVGCLDSEIDDEDENGPPSDEIDDEDENGPPSDEVDDEGSRRDLDLRLYNYRDETVDFTVDADADGETAVSGTFELEAPDTIFTEKTVATFPEGTETVTVDATAAFADRQESATRSFDLPAPDPIEGFEVRLNSHGTLSIEAMPFDSPG